MSTPAKEQGVLDVCEGKFVDFVNPKLRGYNKPFFLATTIGFMTSVVVVIFIMRNLDKKENCTLQSFPLFVQSPYALKHVKDSHEGVDCILGHSHFIAETGGANGGMTVLCQRMDDVGSDAGMDQYFEYCDLSVQEEFFPEEQISRLHWNGKSEAACKEQVNTYGGTWHDGVGADEKKGGRWFQHCTPVLDACMGGHGDVSLVWYRKCPDPVLTVGAVLGYAAWVELVFTVVIILPLLSIGFIKNGKDGKSVKSMEGWLKELKEDIKSGVNDVVAEEIDC